MRNDSRVPVATSNVAKSAIFVVQASRLQIHAQRRQDACTTIFHVRRRQSGKTECTEFSVDRNDKGASYNTEVAFDKRRILHGI